MANKRISELTREVTTPEDDDYIALDGKNGTRKMAAGVLAKESKVDSKIEALETGCLPNTRFSTCVNKVYRQGDSLGNPYYSSSTRVVSTQVAKLSDITSIGVVEGYKYGFVTFDNDVCNLAVMEFFTDTMTAAEIEAYFKNFTSKYATLDVALCVGKTDDSEVDASETDLGDILILQMARIKVGSDNLDEELEERIKNDPIVSGTVKQYAANYKVGTGYIGSEKKAVASGTLKSVSIFGQTKIILENQHDDIADIKGYDIYYASGLMASSTSEITQSDKEDDFKGGETISFAAEAGYNQLYIRLNLYSIFANDLAKFRTSTERNSWLSQHITSISATFKGCCVGGDNACYFKQAQGSFGNWIGSNKIGGTTPASSSRSLDMSAIIGDGYIWLAIYSTTQGSSTLYAESLKLSVSYKGLYRGIGYSSSTMYINDKVLSLSKPLKACDSCYDELVLSKTESKKRTIVTRVADLTLTATNLASAEYETTDYGTTDFKIPLSVLSEIKTDEKPLVISADHECEFHYGTSLISNGCELDEEYLHIIYDGAFDSLSDAVSFFTGAHVLYGVEESISSVYGSTDYLDGISIGSEISLYVGCLDPISSVEFSALSSCVESSDFVDCYIPSVHNGSENEIIPHSSESCMNTIDVDSSVVKNRMYGSGAALTESSAYLLYNMDSEARKELLTELFGTSGFSFVRISMGTCDFRVSADETYTYDDAASVDADIPTFSIGDKDEGTKDYKYIIPILKEIKAINYSVKIVAMPWHFPSCVWGKDASAWAYNETNCKYIANYFVKFIQAYEKEGLPIYAVSLINEPEFTPKFTAENIADIVQNYLGPAISAKYPYVRVMGFESNCNQSDWLVTVSDEKKDFVDAIAIHTYYGAMAENKDFLAFRKHNSAKEMFMTERRCMIADTKYSAFSIAYKQIAYDCLQNNCPVVIFWNMILDEKGNPAGGGNTGRRGVITLSHDYKYAKRNAEYYMLQYIGQMTKKPSSVVHSTSLPDNAIYSTAIRDADKISVLVMNYNNGDRNVAVNFDDETINIRVPQCGSVLVVKYGL